LIDIKIVSATFGIEGGNGPTAPLSYAPGCTKPSLRPGRGLEIAVLIKSMDVRMTKWKPET